jgi:hypothetical protein
VTVNGFDLREDVDIEEIRLRAYELQDALVSQFTATEREYIAIAETIFNEDCKTAKKEMDMLRQGYTNISEEYYVPIRRASIAFNVDKWTYHDELASVSDFSFNKDTVKGARNELFIDDLTGVLNKHIGGISQYSSLALALDSYNILFNINIGENPNSPINIKSESENVWLDGAKYISEIIDDIKGIAKTRGVGTRAVGWLRGSYAKYQLGANPKVWVTQLSSFVAATNILDVGDVVKGIGVKVDGDIFDTYCPLAKVRNSENTAALAQGVIEKTGKIGDVLMKPIGAVDRYVVKKLFAACQVKIEKQGGGSIGTKENMQKAGALLERVILETQQNALATERSAAMRSGSEILRSFTMFSADSMKLTGRVVDAFGEVSILRAELKTATDAKEIAVLKKRLAAANKKALRAIASLVASAMFMAAVTLLFKWVYNKDDKDEDVAKNLAADAVGNMMGGLPFIRDVYSSLVDGYDVENFFYSGVNDLLKSATDVRDLCSELIEGKPVDRRDIVLTLRKMMYSTGQVLGIPTRNLYNTSFGLLKRVTPETAYKVDDLFYKQSYRADLAEALERGDEDMIATITGLMLNENVGGIDNAQARKEIDRLVQGGFDIIPRSVPDAITYDSVQYPVSAKEQKAFKKIYYGANKSLEKIVATSQYKALDDESKAKAIDWLYTYYYNLALQDFLGLDIGNKNLLFGKVIDVETLAVIIATAKGLTADVDKNGKTVNGSKKKKVEAKLRTFRLSAIERAIVMSFLGYSSDISKVQIEAYLNRFSLSKEERLKMLNYMGFSSKK